MLADDLVALVALDALGARVPARHHAVGVEHEDRIVDHALDQQPEALFALAQRLLVKFAVGEVARDLGEAEQPALFVAQRGDDHVRPEARAILAYAPTLVLEAPLGGRDLELVLRPAAVDRLAGVEGREVAADDLLGAVALEALRAGVPRHDAAVPVEQEKCVVLGLLDEQLVKAWVDQVLIAGHNPAPWRRPCTP